MLKSFYQRGWLTTDDKMKIKQHVKTLDDVQKSYYNLEEKDLENTAKDIFGKNSEKLQDILQKFIVEEANLNPKDKDYRQKLLDIKNHILIEAIEGSGKDLKTGFLFWDWNTKLGNFTDSLRGQKISVDPFPALQDLSPSKIDLNRPTNIKTGTVGTSSNFALNMVNGGTITGKYNPNRKINKKSSPHHAIDIAAKKGSPIVLEDFGIPLTVKEQGNDAYNDKAGIWTRLEGTYENGDKVEVLFAHLQNGSQNFSVGDTVNTGDVIAKVGNTGRTGNSEKGIGMYYDGKDYGYHVHLSIKVNGKPVNPTTWKPPVQTKKIQKQKVMDNQKTDLKDIFNIFERI